MMMTPTRLITGSGWRGLCLGSAVVLLAAACAGGGDDLTSAGSVAIIVPSGGTTPTVALHPSTGHGYVAWVGSDGDLFNVYLAVAEPGSTDFSAPRRVNDIAGDAAPHEQAPAQVGVGPGGEVFVVWQNNTVIEGRRFPASDLRLAVSVDGGASFGPAITVNDDAGTVPSSHTFHNLTVADDGTVFVSWIDSREQDRAEVGHATAAEMSMGHDLGPDIRIASSSDGGRTFTSSTVIDVNSCPCCRTGIAVGPDGTVYVAWRKVYPGDIRDIVVAASAPGTLEFSDPVRVHHDDWVFPGCPHAGPSLATDDRGRLHVGWYTGEENKQGLWHTFSDDKGSSFGSPQPLATGEWVPPSQVALTLVGAGAVGAWEDRRAKNATVAVGSLGSTDGGKSVTMSTSGRNPAVAGNGNRALFVWLDGEAIRGQWVADAASPTVARSED